jgi:hypothetical protein
VIRLSRLALAAVAILFGLYHALLGFLFLGEYQNPAYAIVGLVAYLAALSGGHARQARPQNESGRRPQLCLLVPQFRCRS